jgi:tRNA pseudouridine32 synthase/23S rRNA pseudouridine746 synthase/23S rRNA pseudouridine1911/1915/1917 synthase
VNWDWPALRARALAETDDYLVLDKPAGISVTGERHDTDLVRIAADAGERVIPVHRIDKVTSGVVLLARSTSAHGPLTRQFAKRTVAKCYLAVVRSDGSPPAGTVALPLCTGRKNRVRVAAPREEISYSGGRWTVPPGTVRPDGLDSTTDLRPLWSGGGLALLVARPHTGRRHQIRVHLAWIGHPIVGDPLFEKPAPDERTGLHAWRLAFDDADGRRVEVHADPGADFWAPLAAGLPDDRRDALLASPA